MSDINVTVQDEIVNIDILDTPVLVNVVNSPGVPGAPGQGVPVGGTTGQVLAKSSATNYDTAWVNVSGGAWGTITGTLSNQTDLQNALNAKVPYTGATTNVNLGEYEIKAGQVTLDTSPTGTAAVGTTRWNDTTGLTETTLKGRSVILKNGVDLVARVVNKVSPNTTLTKAAYQAVRVSGAQGQRLAVALAQANNDNNSADTIGLVIETIATNQEGFIMTVGQIEGINTTGSLQGETWNDGDIIYLSPTVAGAVTNVKPSGGQHLVIIGYVEYAHANNGKLYIKISNGWELTELHDTDIVSPANNQGLFYESSSALWKNKSISTVLGYTPEQPLTFNSPLSRSVNAVSIPQATGSVNGFLSSTDWTTFNSKQNALGYTAANAATTLTINGVTFDLSANRTFTVGTITGSGASGQVAFWTGASAQSGSNNLFWDATNSRLGIGTSTPASRLEIASLATFATGINFNNSGSIGYIWGDGSSMNIRPGGTHGIQISAGSAGLLQATATAGGFRIELQSLVSQPIYTYFGDNNTGIGRAGDDILTLHAGGEKARIFSTGNLLLQNGGTFTDTGERLQVTGTMKVTGASSFGGNMSLSLNQNSGTSFTVTNTTSGTAAGCTFALVVSGSQAQIFKNSPSTNAFKIIGANDFGFANLDAGDIAFLNNAVAGNIKFAAGSSSTAHMTIKANGRINMSSLPTSSTGLATGDLWNDAGTIKIV